jgi:NADPH:quinone reductase
MKALVAHRLVGLDGLAAEDIAAPTPGPGEVLVGVGAATIHLADVAALAGERHPRPALPFTPGLEAAGLIAAVGPEVEGFKQGDRVAAFLPWGGLAEGAVTSAALCAKLPDSLGFAVAASLPIVYAGALMALRDRARLGVGQTLLVLGGGGEAGLAAVEIGKRLGARVIAVTNESRGSEASERGADHLIDAASRPLTESVGALTANKGVDVAFDPVGGDAFEIAQLTLQAGGRMVSAGFAGGRVPRVNLAAFHARNAELIAANTPLAAQNDPLRAQMALRDVIAWAEEGIITPKIAAQFTLADMRPAFDYVKQRRNAGAVVITIGKEA